MTAGWAALNTLREVVEDAVQSDTASMLALRRALQGDAALALVQTALEAAERVDEASAAVPVVTDDVWAACENLHAALRAVREGQ